MGESKIKYVSTWYEGDKRCRQEKEMAFMPDGGEENNLLNLYPYFHMGHHKIFDGTKIFVTIISGSAQTESAAVE